MEEGSAGEVHVIKGKRKLKAKTWTFDETSCLFDSWDSHMKDLKKVSAKRPIFEKISQELAANGWKRSGKQVQKRMNLLKQQFHKENNLESGSAPSDWPYLDQMRRLFNDDPYYTSSLTHMLDICTTIATISGDDSTESTEIHIPVQDSIRTRKAQKRGKNKTAEDINHSDTSYKVKVIDEDEKVVKKRIREKMEVLIDKNIQLADLLIARLSNSPAVASISGLATSTLRKRRR